jgi:tetratricopeptide (TPR) repeat protein
VRNHCARCAGAAAVLLLLCASAEAQSNEVTVFAGEIRGAPNVRMRGFLVTLEAMGNHHELARADVGTDGAFQFRHVPYGDYLLKLETYFGDTIQQTFVTINSASGPVVIRMAKQADARPPSGQVSVARLQRPPAKGALKAFVAAQEFSRSGRYADAAKELERAVVISPDFADAFSNLGAQYVRLGRFEDAILEISHAMEIGQSNAVDLSNLACAQLALRRFDDAMKSSRAALQADPGNAGAHYVLGVLLARDGRTLREAIPHLERAAEENKSADVFLQKAKSALTDSK